MYYAQPGARVSIRARAGPASSLKLIDCETRYTHRSVLVASLDVRGCYAALAAHASQLVWFRRLFVVFSAYTYANRLVVIE